MDYNELVKDIVRQVMAQMMNDTPSAVKSGKQSFLVVTPKHGERCHAFLESAAMTARFDMVCAMSKGYDWELSGCAGLAVFGLSNSDIARLESGICDTPYTALISKALVMGLPVFAVREETEILCCDRKTPYAEMFGAKLKALEGWGLTLCGYGELEGLALGGAKAGVAAGKAKFSCRNRVVTERDVITARDAGARVIETVAKPIITDLAKECARKHGIEFAAR